jgi:hypothetical protein
MTALPSEGSRLLYCIDERATYSDPNKALMERVGKADACNACVGPTCDPVRVHFLIGNEFESVKEDFCRRTLTQDDYASSCRLRRAREHHWCDQFITSRFQTPKESLCRISTVCRIRSQDNKAH